MKCARLHIARFLANLCHTFQSTRLHIFYDCDRLAVVFQSLFTSNIELWEFLIDFYGLKLVFNQSYISLKLVVNGW